MENEMENAAPIWPGRKVQE